MIPLALALVLCWPSVDLDCAGGPETIAYYRITTGALTVAGFTVDGDPIYTSGPGPFVPNVAPGPTELCTFPLEDDPPIGGVFLYDVEAVDVGGNDSTACPG